MFWSARCRTIPCVANFAIVIARALVDPRDHSPQNGDYFGDVVLFLNQCVAIEDEVVSAFSSSSLWVVLRSLSVAG